MVLSLNEWKFIFLSLNLARTVFANNPVLQDVMADNQRERFIDDLSDIMDKIGLDGKEAALRGIECVVQGVEELS